MEKLPRAESEPVRRGVGRPKGSLTSKDIKKPASKGGKSIGKKRGRKGKKYILKKQQQQQQLGKLKPSSSVELPNITKIMEDTKAAQQQRQRQLELDNRLRQEADDMQELLREKTWYRKYVAKIAEDEAQNLRDKDALLAKLLSKSSPSEASTLDTESLIRKT